MVWLGWPEEAGMNGNFWMYHDVPNNLVTLSLFDGVIHFAWCNIEFLFKQLSRVDQLLSHVGVVRLECQIRNQDQVLRHSIGLRRKRALWIIKNERTVSVLLPFTAVKRPIKFTAGNCWSSDLCYSIDLSTKNNVQSQMIQRAKMLTWKNVISNCTTYANLVARAP